MKGSDSLNIGRDFGADVKTDSNHHETAVDSGGLDDA